MSVIDHAARHANPASVIDHAARHAARPARGMRADGAGQRRAQRDVLAEFELCGNRMGAAAFLGAQRPSQAT
jgi:hypothetical protein